MSHGKTSVVLEYFSEHRGSVYFLTRSRMSTCLPCLPCREGKLSGRVAVFRKTVPLIIVTVSVVIGIYLMLFKLRTVDSLWETISVHAVRSEDGNSSFSFMQSTVYEQW